MTTGNKGDWYGMATGDWHPRLSQMYKTED